MLPHDLLAQILEESRSIHRSGSMSPTAIIALAKYLEARRVQHSVETGTGASTIIFSHLSEAHTVFTVDVDESKTLVLRNPLLKPETITFVDGPIRGAIPG